MGAFSKEEFRKKAEDIQTETIKRLNKEYPGKEIKVVITNQERDLKTQEKYQKKGASKSSISLHNFGAAVDYLIFMDGKKYDASGKGPYGIIKPYQILGGVAREHDLFWGWDFDSGHVGETRFVDQFVSKYPETAIESEMLGNWYKENYSRTKAQNKPLIEVLDSLYETIGVPKREFYGNPRTIDPLLDVAIPKISEDEKVFGYIK